MSVWKSYNEVLLAIDSVDARKVSPFSVLHSACKALANVKFAMATMSRVMKCANTNFYDKLGKVKKEVVRKSNYLMDVVAKSKAKQEKAFDRVRQKYERREVVFDCEYSNKCFQVRKKRYRKPHPNTLPIPKHEL